MLIGMAAGLSAIFRSPIGTAFFAIEVLYRDMEFETRAFLHHDCEPGCLCDQWSVCRMATSFQGSAVA